jgi:hypothetical protein
MAKGLSTKGTSMSRTKYFNLSCLRLFLGLLGAMSASSAIAGELTWRTAIFDNLQTFREEETPSGGAGAIELSLARGETEGCWLVVYNNSDEVLQSPQFVISSLPGVAIKVYAAGSINLEKPGQSTNAQPGHYFDLLRPAGWEEVKPGAFRPYWLDFSVAGENCESGPKEGTVTIRAVGIEQSIPFRLKVRNFILPTTPKLKIAFATGLGWMEKYYGRQLTPTEIRAHQDLMLDHRLGPLPMWDDGESFFDRETVRHCLDRGMNVVLLKCGGKTDEQSDQSLEKLEPKIALLEELGALDRTYLFGFDEIVMCHPELIPQLRRTYGKFHERHPGIKRINTAWPDERLKGAVDIFVVPVANYVSETSRQCETWWYSVGSDRLNDEPDYRLDFPGVAQRCFFIADWYVGATGHLYWAVQREWPTNAALREAARPEDGWQLGYISSTSGKRSDDNGAGNLFYPDQAGGMLPSARVKRIRDGIEDYEYLVQLQAAVDRLGATPSAEMVEPLEQAHRILTEKSDIIQFSNSAVPGWNVRGPRSAFNLTSHPNAVRTGERALRILPEAEARAVFQELPAQPGESYTVSAWVKTDDLPGAAKILAELLDAESRVLAAADSAGINGSTGPKNFFKLIADLPVAPHGTTKLRVSLVARKFEAPATDADLQNNPLAKAFFEDVSVKANGREVTLKNPDFEIPLLKITDDPNRLLQFREQIGDLLDQLTGAAAAGEKKNTASLPKPFFLFDAARVVDREFTDITGAWQCRSAADNATARETIQEITDSKHLLSKPSTSGKPEKAGLVAPFFYATDPAAQTLAKAAGQSTVAVREFPEWSSVYFSLPLTREWLLGLCRYAGAHVYSDSYDVCFANRNYLLLHTSQAGRKNLALPAGKTAEDLFTGESIPLAQQSFFVDLPAGTTKIYKLREDGQ